MVAPPRVHKCRIGCRFSITRSCAMIPRIQGRISIVCKASSWARPGWSLSLESGRRAEPSSAHSSVIQIRRMIQIRTQIQTQVVGCCLKAGEEQGRLQVLTHPSHALPGLASCFPKASSKPSHIQPPPSQTQPSVICTALSLSKNEWLKCVIGSYLPTFDAV